MTIAAAMKRNALMLLSWAALMGVPPLPQALASQSSEDGGLEWRAVLVDDLFQQSVYIVR